MADALPYDSSKFLSEYLLLHYGTEEDILGGLPGPKDAVCFPVRSVRNLMSRIPRQAVALDLGCAVGRSTFDLGQVCESALGIDYSKPFIDAAEAIRNGNPPTVLIPDSGNLTREFRVNFDPGASANRVRFEQGDACALRKDLGGFHIVHAANLLCRLPDPQRLVDRLPDLVQSGGQLLLTTPFSWLEEYTPKNRWLGASEEGAPATKEVLVELLKGSFRLEFETDLPFLIREHARKFQYGVAWGSRWRRL
jgi:putative 4-mercaptohistidine N1-methyltranferase